MGRDKRKTRGRAGSSEFTNAADLQNRFFAESEERRKKGDKTTGDAGYWNGGRCNWGGSHNLQEDCEALAKFFNDTNSIADDVEQIKLSANETVFNQKKQALTSKIKNLNSKCNVTESYSITNVCCIWNDYFGKFLKPFLNTFSAKLSRQLSEVEKLTPKHQQELLKLEQEARELQSAYDENVRKANDPNTSPEDKTKFLILANQISEKAKRLKSKIKQNPLADLSRFSNLDDLTTLLGGNVPKNPPSNKKKDPKKDNDKGGGGSNNPNPLEEPNDFFERYKKEIFVTFALFIALFLLYTQKDTEDEDTKEDKKLMRQMMLMKTMSEKQQNE